MTEILQPVDAEGSFITYLTPKLGVHCSTDVNSSGAPDSFVLVSRAGGVRHSLVEERPTLLFECYAPDSVAACDLANRCWAYVNAAGQSYVDDVTWCNSSDPSSPINQPDPDFETRHRYQFYAVVVVSLLHLQDAT